MSYVTQASRPKPAAMAGALGVPGAFAAILVAGLAVTVVVPPVIDNPVATQIRIEPIDPPPTDPVPPDAKASAAQQPATTSQTVITRPDSDFAFDLGPTAPVGDLPGLGEGLDLVGPVDFGIPEVTPTPGLDPVRAAPKGNPGEWIGDSDYRTSWINRGYSGQARFALSIDARGRVSDCRITGSTGHQALDDATCRLIERRARFAPARDSSGNPVAGSYANVVNWRIPE